MSQTPFRQPLAWRQCCQCLRRQQLRSTPLQQNRFLSTTNTLRSTARSNNNPLRNSQTRAQQRSIILPAAGMAACAAAMYGIIKLDVFGLEQAEANNKAQKSNGNGSMKMDGPSGFPSSPSVIRIQGQDGVEQVATGNSTVSHFPSTIKLPKSIDPSTMKPGEELRTAPESEEEYQLLGLGIRTVSFLAIQVYVVGVYVAKSDLATLQQRLVRMAVQPLGSNTDATAEGGAVAATSLVPMERQALKELLLDPVKGEDAWNAILKEGDIRTAIRIVPTRNTDFLHMRDGFVRGISARAQRAAQKAKESAGPEARSEFQDDTFGAAVNDFKSLFGGGQRKNIPKGNVLLLLRDSRGALDALFQTDPAQPIRWLGRVTDERISRLLWMNYLAGKTVSSEPARQSVVEGVMGIVERPVGTVIQKVI
ncbi:hypothetical protein VTN00DRAFT_2298 [Thermoascus crustaceus]|uniref:uncharacterized protein n=1 Tax=Thermoascus crustaceus TaxID=5088 RepID=UPI0037447A54